MPLTAHFTTPSSFEKLLKHLTNIDRWEMLETNLSPLPPILEEFKSRRWCIDRLPENPEFKALPTVTLFIIYQTRLLIESVQQTTSTDSEANLYLLIPLYLLPAYQLWVQENPAIARPSQQKAPMWFFNPQSTACLDEINIPHPTNLATAELTRLQGSTNLSRRLADARSQLYLWLCQSLGINAPKEQAPLPKVHHAQPAELTIDGLPQALQPIAHSTITCPLLQNYFSQPDVQHTYIKLLHQQQSQSTIIVIANQIIADRLAAIASDQTQQAAASDLLCHLASWAPRGDQALTYQTVEAR